MKRPVCIGPKLCHHCGCRYPSGAKPCARTVLSVQLDVGYPSFCYQWFLSSFVDQIDGLVQDYSISIALALAMEIPKSGTKQWLIARLQYLQCISNGDTAVWHKTIEITSYNGWDLPKSPGTFSVKYSAVYVWTGLLFLYPPNNEVVGGYIGFTPSVCPSVCPSVRPSVRPSVCPGCRVRSVTSTVLDGFFPY